MKTKHRSSVRNNISPAPATANLAYSNEKNVRIAAMIDKRAPRLAQLLDCALSAIAGSFEATRTIVIEKKVVDAGPDHYARLTGAKRLLEFTLAGRPTPRPEDQEKPKLTLQELEELLRENGQLPPGYH